MSVPCIIFNETREIMNPYEILVGKPERKRPLTKPKGRLVRVRIIDMGSENVH
jgi:hypothetical protein